MERKRRTFTKDFKEQAVRLAQELGSNSEAGRQLGITETAVRNWRKDAEIEKKMQNSDPSFSFDELKRLKKENEQLRKVNDILRKAAAFFSQDHLK